MARWLKAQWGSKMLRVARSPSIPPRLRHQPAPQPGSGEVSPSWVVVSNELEESAERPRYRKCCLRKVTGRNTAAVRLAELRTAAVRHGCNGSHQHESTLSYTGRPNVAILSGCRYPVDIPPACNEQVLSPQSAGFFLRRSRAVPTGRHRPAIRTRTAGARCALQLGAKPVMTTAWARCHLPWTTPQTGSWGRSA
jgi:hypothetical protein